VKLNHKMMNNNLHGTHRESHLSLLAESVKLNHKMMTIPNNAR